ncbi:MAG: hypothetical protein DRP00_01435 [Candidatus Aenigmatarchaeota archaeon]|nr:MAG: hypothetical protein DRP00_01435 [Candidatus Aenigmarchaeota archaeon]
MKVIVVDGELHKKLKILAANRGISLKQLVNEILENYIKSSSKRKP